MNKSAKESSRVADACKFIAKDYDKLVRDLDWQKLCTKLAHERGNAMECKLRAAKVQIHELRQKIAAMEAK